MIVADLLFEEYDYKKGEFKKLPVACGVYIIVLKEKESETIIYIGRTTQLRYRIQSHDKIRKLKKRLSKASNIIVAFHKTRSHYRSLEKWIICTVGSKLNIATGVVKCSKSLTNYINKNKVKL